VSAGSAYGLRPTL